MSLFILWQNAQSGATERVRAALGRSGMLVGSLREVANAGVQGFAGADVDLHLEAGGALGCIRGPGPVPEQWHREGWSALAGLRGGRFAAVRMESGHVRAAVDPLGIEPLYYASVDGGFACGTRADLVAAALGIRQLDRQAVFNYLWNQVVPAPRSVWAGVRRLPPGHALDGDTKVLRAQRYWHPVFAEPAAAFDAASAALEFLAVLRGGVAAQIDSAPVGAFLSGGIDSSTVCGLLAEHRAGAQAFSIGFGERAYDELDFARTSAAHYGLKHRTRILEAADVTAAVARIARFYGEPFGNASAVPTLYCAELAAEHGVDRLLAGDGGDELFGGNERYAKQQVYDHYGRLPRWLRAGLIEPLARLPGADRGRIGKPARYAREAARPLKERIERWNHLRHFGLDEVFDAAFLDGLDVSEPARLQAGWMDEARARTTIDRMMWLDWHQTLSDNDLPKVSGMCALAGIDVRYPWLDARLVDFALRLPAREKVRGRRLRHFVKQALAEFLPGAVIAKRKHGFGLPVGPWLAGDSMLHAWATDALGALEARGLLRAGFARRLIGQELARHPAYFGGFVWVLAMLEQWLREHDACW
ncbi:MAG: asparagine synthase [Chromatiales bacterium]|nr:asparagine synthase [Chromatiales bacterium]